MARPIKHNLDEKLLEQLALIQCSNKEIAIICGCSTDTLERRYAGILEKGREQGKMSLRRKQFEVAMSGNVSMLIWLGKQMLSQKDEQNFTGSVSLHDQIMAALKSDKRSNLETK